MKKVITGIILLYTNFIYSQINHSSYEEIAYNYFVKEIIQKELHRVQRFEFKGVIETSSSGYSNCMPQRGIDTLQTSALEIAIVENKLIARRISFLERIFIPKSKRRKIIVFKSYLFEDSIVVCIGVFAFSINDDDNFFTFKINQQTKEVEGYCVTAMEG